MNATDEVRLAVAALPEGVRGHVVLWLHAQGRRLGYFLRRDVPLFHPEPQELDHVGRCPVRDPLARRHGNPTTLRFANTGIT